MIKKTSIVMSAATLAVIASPINTYASQEGVVTADVLNVRSGPSTSYSKVGKLYSGNTLNILEAKNGWYRVDFKGEANCWVSSSYVKTSSSLVSFNSQGVVNTDILNVRSGPSTSYSKVGKLYKGESVKISEKSNGWYKVSTSKGVNGWVSGTYINLGDTNNVGSVSGEIFNSQGNVNADVLNVRSGPSTSYSKVGKLYKGESVKISEKSNGWYKVSTSKGVNGWVSGTYINLGATNNVGGSDTTVNSKVASVVNIAKAQVGKPYVWGAEGPNSFDCSGLIYYAYKNGASITIPRVSRDQAKYGSYVSTSNMKAGDIIYFDSTKDGVVNHVAMYIGDGKYVHAPRSGENVRIDSTSSSYFTKYALGARRIIK